MRREERGERRMEVRGGLRREERRGRREERGERGEERSRVG